MLIPTIGVLQHSTNKYIWINVSSWVSLHFHQWCWCFLKTRSESRNDQTLLSRSERLLHCFIILSKTLFLISFKPKVRDQPLVLYFSCIFFELLHLFNAQPWLKFNSKTALSSFHLNIPPQTKWPHLYFVWNRSHLHFPSANQSVPPSEPQPCG